MIIRKSSLLKKDISFLSGELESFITKDSINKTSGEVIYLHERLFKLITNKHSDILGYVRQFTMGELLYVFYNIELNFCGDESRQKYGFKKCNFNRLLKYFQSTIVPYLHPGGDNNKEDELAKFIGFESFISRYLIKKMITKRKKQIEGIDQTIDVKGKKTNIVRDYISGLASVIQSMKKSKFVFGMDKNSLVGIFERVFFYFLKKKFRNFDEKWMGKYLMKISLQTTKLVNSNIKKYLRLMSKLNILFDENGNYEHSDKSDDGDDDGSDDDGKNNFDGPKPASPRDNMNIDDFF